MRKPRMSRPDRAQQKAAISRAWKELFERFGELKEREQARQRAQGGTPPGGR